MHPLPERGDLQQGNTNMLAEIFMVRLEMLMRVAASNAAAPVSDKRFVPVTLPQPQK
jgi:hypothetical protein